MHGADAAFIDAEDPGYKQHVLEPGVMHIDNRVGSKEFEGDLHGSMALKTRVEKLPFADFAFLGNGPDGPGTLRIGVERKAFSDLVSSLMKNRLFEHQIPGLLREYDLIWVLIEGRYKPDTSDLILVPGFSFVNGKKKDWRPAHAGITYSQLDKWLMTYDVMGMGRLKRWRTQDPWESVYFLADLFRYFDKPWEKHHAHRAVGKWKPGGMPSKVLLNQPSDIQRVACSLPGVGSEIGRRMARHFRSTWEMLEADPEEWEKCGMAAKNAQKLWLALRKRIR